MKKILFILTTILLLFSIPVCAVEFYDEATITNPNGTDFYLSVTYEKYVNCHIPAGEKITDIVDSDEEDKYIFGYYEGSEVPGYVLIEDTSLANGKSKQDQSDLSETQTGEIAHYDEIIITNPDGAGAEYIPKDGETTYVQYVHLPCGTKLTDVSTKCQQTEMYKEDYVTGVANNGNKFYVKQEDTSIENVYPPADEAQIEAGNSSASNDEPLIWPWIVLVIVLFLGFYFLSAYLKKPQCPKCKARNSRETKREFLNSEKVYFKEEERVKEYSNKGKYRSNTMHKASTNQYVNPPDKILVKEKLIEGTREYYKVMYQCNKCGEEFSRKEFVDRKPKIV